MSPRASKPRPEKPVGGRSGANHGSAVEVGLNAAICAVIDNNPCVLVVKSTKPEDVGVEGLPYGAFTPGTHRTLEEGLRAWVKKQTGLDLGYVEQLYTFADRGRHPDPTDTGPHVVSIGYLALVNGFDPAISRRGDWRPWYDFFPWEDWRKGKPPLLSAAIEPLLAQWAAAPETPEYRRRRPLSPPDRLRLNFGMGSDASWDEERALDRYEVLYEAVLVQEAVRDGRKSGPHRGTLADLGRPMRYDHRRILATAVGRLRGKIKYRPVVFELMPAEFTLLEFQKVVEAILGPPLHKQNFRRLVQKSDLVEPTGGVRNDTGGRPAGLFRFRPSVILERPAPGLRLNPGRGKGSGEDPPSGRDGPQS